ncbi:MAG: radical SAM protein [Candidatus Muirbacterium halophilum]|nr:radical SAM protein [Candidatus Muirbacterium halophilum]
MVNILLLRFNTLKIRRNAVPPFNLDFFLYIFKKNKIQCILKDMFLKDINNLILSDFTHIIIESYSYNIKELYKFINNIDFKKQILLSTGNYKPDHYIFKYHISAFDEKSLKKIFNIKKHINYFKNFTPKISHSSNYSFLYPMPFLKKATWKYTISGIGCPGKCKFCSGNIRKGPRAPIKNRNIKTIIYELKALKEKGFNYIVFDDDNFFRDKEFAIDLINNIINNELNIKWNTHARADSLDEELIILLKKSGCCFLRIGAESGSQKILTQSGKGKNYLQNIFKTAKLLKKHKIPFIFLTMLGFPDETIKDLWKTFFMIVKTRPFLIQLHNFVPYEDSYYGKKLGINHNLFHYSSFKKTFSKYPWWVRDFCHILFYLLFGFIKFLNLDFLKIIFFYFNNINHFKRLLFGNRE